MAITSTRNARPEEESDELRRIAQRRRALRRRIPSLAAAALFVVSGAEPETPDNSSSEGRKKGHMK